MKDLIISQKASGKTFVVSDLHGVSLATFKSFFESNIHENDELVICGDIIDRGSDSIKLLLYIIDQNKTKEGKIKIILGNHEVAFLCAYALTFLDENDDDRQIRQEIEGFFNTQKLDDLVSRGSPKHLGEVIFDEGFDGLAKSGFKVNNKNNLREIFNFLNDQPLCRRIRPAGVTEENPEQDLYFIHSNLPQDYCCSKLSIGTHNYKTKPENKPALKAWIATQRINAIWWKRDKDYTRHLNKTIYCGHDHNRPFIQKMDQNCTYHNLDFCTYGSGVIVAENIDDKTLCFVHNPNSEFQEKNENDDKKIVFNEITEKKILRTSHLKDYQKLGRFYSNINTFFQELQRNDSESQLLNDIISTIEQIAQQLTKLYNEINTSYLDQMNVCMANAQAEQQKTDSTTITIKIDELIDNGTSYDTFITCSDGQTNHDESNNADSCQNHFTKLENIRKNFATQTQAIQQNIEKIKIQAQEYTDFSYYAFCLLGSVIATVGVFIPLFFQGYRNYFFSSSLEYTLNPVLEDATNTIQQITMQ